MTLRVQGLDELTSALAREAVNAPKVASDVVSEVAQHVKDTARSVAPVGATGALRDSIHVSVAGNRTTREVGPSVRYGGYVEFGTSDTAPQPFMQPAIDKHADELVEKLMKLVGNL